MNKYIFSTLAFPIIELVAAAGIVFWVGRRLKSKRDSGLGRFVLHPRRVWFALVLFLVPMVMERMFFLRMLSRPPGSGGVIHFSIILSVILDVNYGGMYGVVGCLLAVPENEQKQFNSRLALGIAAAFVLLFSGVSMFGGFYRPFSVDYIPVILAALAFFTFRASRPFPKKNAGASPDVVEPQKLKSPALALVIGFLPSALILAIMPTATGGKVSVDLLMVGCVVGIICCFTSSFMLFRRRTKLAIFGGVIFLLLNAVISLFFGCATILIPR